MPQSLSQVYVHLVFSTKNRQPLITHAIASELYPYMATVFNHECRSPAKLIGGVEDHTHALFNLSRTWAIADVVEAKKDKDVKMVKTKGTDLHSFQWQTGSTVHFRLAGLIWMRLWIIFAIKRSITERPDFRMNFAGCCVSMMLNLMKGLFGIELATKSLIGVKLVYYAAPLVLKVLCHPFTKS